MNSDTFTTIAYTIADSSVFCDTHFQYNTQYLDLAILLAILAKLTICFKKSQRLWIGIANLEEFWPFLCIWLIFTSIFPSSSLYFYTDLAYICQ